MSQTLIEKLYKDNIGLSEYLLGKGEVTFQSQLDDNFKKILLIAAASNLEQKLTEILIDFAKNASKGCQPLLAFIQNKAIKRQYHTFFDWQDKRASVFFGLFGGELKEKIDKDISNNNELDKGIKAFMEIGHWRNQIIHGDYAAFYLDKTAKEVFDLYESSLEFISYMSDILSDSIPRSD